MFRSVFLILTLPLFLAGCGGKSVWAPDEKIDAVRYSTPGPSLTLFTMVSNSTGNGAHSALMINASQRVIFDPAGTVNEKNFIPERNDVLFGITPAVEDFYTRAHARKTYHVVIQHVPVSAEVAELALQKAMKAGPVTNAQCAATTSALLSGLPGFESIRGTWFPNKLAEQFQAIPGVTRKELYEYDDEDKSKALQAWDPAKFKAQKSQ